MFKNSKGFTLIEMLIVLMVISILIILFIPNISEKNKNINATGCDALVSVVQAQVDAYYLDKGSYPSNLEQLAEAKYIKEDQKSCQGNKQLRYSNGIVSKPGS